MNKLLCFTEVEKYYVTHYKRLNIYQIHMRKSFLFTLQLGTIYRHRTLSYHYYCVFSGFLYCLLYSLLHLFYVLIFSLFVTVLLSTCLIEMYRKKKNVLYQMQVFTLLFLMHPSRSPLKVFPSLHQGIYGHYTFFFIDWDLLKTYPSANSLGRVLT